MDARRRRQGSGPRDNGSAAGSSAIVTYPNAISLLRIMTIPVFCYLIVHPDTVVAGLFVFGAVVATDWVDGFVARRLGQVSEIGKILDPTADRLALAGGLIAMVVAGIFPLWAALLILARDGLILLVGGLLIARGRVRLDVRFIGKAATFSLMLGIPWIAWGSAGQWASRAALAAGWVLFAVGIVEYYVATAFYFGDIRRAFASTER